MTPAQAAPANGRARAAIARHLASPTQRTGYALVLSSALTSILGVVYWWLAARSWSDADLGQGAALIATMVLVAEISTLGLTSGLVRFLPRAPEHGASLVRRSFAIAAGGAAASASLVVACDRWFDLATADLDAAWTLWFVVATAASAIFVLQDGALTGLGRATVVPIANMAYAITKLAVLLVVATSASGEAIFASWTVPLVAADIGVGWFIVRRGVQRPNSPSKSLHALALRYSVGNHVANLLQRAAGLLLPLIVFASLGSASSSYYVVVWSTAYALYLASSNVGQALVAEGSRSPGRLYPNASSALRQSLMIVCAGALVTVIAAPWYLGFYGGRFASNGTTLLRLLALGAIPNAVTTIFLSVHRVRGGLRQIVPVQAATGLPTVVLAGPVLAVGGLSGLGLLWFANQIAVAVLVLWLGFGNVWAPMLSPGTIRGTRRCADRVSAGIARTRPDATPARGAGIELLSDRNGMVVTRAYDDEGVGLVEKQSSTPDGVKRLHAEAYHLRAITARDDLSNFARLVPTVLSAGFENGTSRLMQSSVPGSGVTTLTADMQVTLARCIGEFHAATTERAVVGPTEIRCWITDRVASITPMLPRSDAALLRALGRELADDVTGRTVSLSWIHGDLSPANVVVSPDATVLHGIVDWESGGRRELPDVDIIQLLLAGRVAGDGDELGQSVNKVIDSGWNAVESGIIESSASCPNEHLGWRSLLLITWLRHVAGNLDKSAHFHRHPLWIARNVMPVIALAPEADTRRWYRHCAGVADPGVSISA